ncbi:hypothetical protein UY3_05135 [Chelonia mydas]|uniref:Uncharacterized protein n=1 Tax=Chelonia mydas TaxID=8469 RepID=M7BPN3_CHEMY|nr:hypothetical protein UY3_05135 [Chelonia mydas]
MKEAVEGQGKGKEAAGTIEIVQESSEDEEHLYIEAPVEDVPFDKLRRTSSCCRNKNCITMLLPLRFHAEGVYIPDFWFW